MSGNKTILGLELCVILVYGGFLFRGVSPSFHESYYLSLLSMGRNDYERARKFSEEELKRFPNDVDAHLLLVRLCLYQKDMKSARAHLKQALRLQPEHKEARMYLKYFPTFPHDK